MFYKISVSILIFCALLSCGGGGGDGSSSIESSKNADQGIRIIHAALDFAPLAIFSANGLVAQAKFADKSFHAFLNTGLHNLVLAPRSNSATPLWASALEIREKTRKSIFVYAGYKDQDLAVSILEDAPSIAEKSFAFFRFVNGIVSDSTAQITIPNLVQSAAVGLGRASAYVPVAPGIYDFIVSSNGIEVSRVNAEIKAATAYSVISHGAAGYLVSTSILED